MKLDWTSRFHASQPCFLQVGFDVKQLGVVHADDRYSGGRKVAQMAISLHNNAGKWRAKTRVCQIMLGRFQTTLRLAHGLTLDLDEKLNDVNLIFAGHGELDSLAGL